MVEFVQSGCCSRFPSVVLSTLEVLGTWPGCFTFNPSVHVPVDFLQQWVQGGVRLGLFDDLHELRVLSDELPEVCHFLKEFWEEKDVVWVVGLQVKFEHVHNALLHFFNVSHV